MGRGPHRAGERRGSVDVHGPYRLDVGGVRLAHEAWPPEGQPRLPLKRLSRWRTYVGVGKSEARLGRLLRGYRFRRAVDVARELLANPDALTRFRIPAAAATA